MSNFSTDSNCWLCVLALYLGSLTLAHGEKTKAIAFTAVANPSEVASYAIHLTDPASDIGGQGAVKLR